MGLVIWNIYIASLYTSINSCNSEISEQAVAKDILVSLGQYNENFKEGN